MQDEDRERRIQELTEKITRFSRTWVGTMLILIVGVTAGLLVLELLDQILRD